MQPENNAKMTPLVFKCKHCPKKYDNLRALGGHVSKQHKCMSSGYLHKMEVRKSREVFRKALELAKEFCKYCGAVNICRERR